MTSAPIDPDSLDDPPRRKMNLKDVQAKLRKVHLVIATPAKSFGTPKYMQSIFHLLSKAGGILGGVSWMTNAARTCSEARSHLVHNFLVEQFGTHMLFVDSDMEWIPETIFEMLALDLPMVTCGYAGHDTTTPGPYAFNVELLHTGEPQTAPTNGCIKIGASGLGFTLLRRDALLEMVKHYESELSYDEVHPTDGSLISRVALFHEPLLDAEKYGREGTRQWFGEDFIFFYRWRAMGPGHDVWLYLNAPLIHHVSWSRPFRASDQLADILQWDQVCKKALPPTRAWHPEVKGWSHDILPFYRLRAHAMPEDARVVEVGVYQGRSLLFLATDLHRQGKGKAELWGIDPGLEFQDPGGPVEPASRERLLEHMERIAPEWGTVKVNALAEKSLDAVAQFEDDSLDLVFLDGNHTKAEVWRDIKAWRTKVKKGTGILAGHDFSDVFPGVVGAVNDAFRTNPSLRVEGSCWMVRPHL